MKIFCKGACCIFVFLSCLPSCFWHGYFCVAYGYFCGMNLGVMHVGLKFNWKGILLMNWTGISQQLKIWCFLECTWKACIKLLHTPFWICLFFFHFSFLDVLNLEFEIIIFTLQGCIGNMKKRTGNFVNPQNWMDHAFYIISSNEQESGRAKQIVGTKDDDLLFVKKSRWFNHIDTAFKVLHAGFVFYHDYDRKLYLLFG